MSDLFKVGEAIPGTNNNVRQSHRKKTKRDLQHTLCLDTLDEED
jgi:hypothetical protein